VQLWTKVLIPKGSYQLMDIRNYQPKDRDQVISLIADYRVFLSGLKSFSKAPDLDAAKNELEDYLGPRYLIYVATLDDEILGYLVCRVDQDVVWAESLFIKPSARRKGVGSALYLEAERLVEKLGGDTVYNWIHPNNTGITQFLKKRGYDVLNLVEVRRPWPGEKNLSKIQVGEFQFRY
jgi:GNAT superfamily N-acetyltransferase